MSDTFSSDRILEHYRVLNEIEWVDRDICRECGCFLNQVTECSFHNCPLEKKDDEDLENNPE